MSDSSVSPVVTAAKSLFTGCCSSVPPKLVLWDLSEATNLSKKLSPSNSLSYCKEPGTQCLRKQRDRCGRGQKEQWRRKEGGSIPSFQPSNGLPLGWQLIVYNTCKDLQKSTKRISACINCPSFQWPFLCQCRPSTASLPLPVMTDIPRGVESSPTTWSCKKNPSSCSNLHVVFILVPLLTIEKTH